MSRFAVRLNRLARTVRGNGSSGTECPELMAARLACAYMRRMPSGGTKSWRGSWPPASHCSRGSATRMATAM
eukprot:3114611-Alexandrium_andersonii.AAC.1